MIHPVNEYQTDEKLIKPFLIKMKDYKKINTKKIRSFTVIEVSCILMLTSLLFGTLVYFIADVSKLKTANIVKKQSSDFNMRTNKPDDKFPEFLIQKQSVSSNPLTCSNIKDYQRFDCFPRGLCNEQSCNARGCCWAPVKMGSENIPWCFYPKNYGLYKVINRTRYERGETLLLNLTTNSVYPKDVKLVKVEITYETKTLLHIKISDPDFMRYEPPYPEVPTFNNFSEDKDYIVEVDEKNFGFAVIRKSTGTTIFDTRGIGGFTFADQFLQISAILPSSYIYGLGERRNKFMLNIQWEKMTLFNHDTIPKDNTNSYGSHPFYLAMEQSGISHGVFLLNSNAMDILLQPAPAITYRTIGGIFDFYFFLGPTPSDVIKQYTEVVGFSFFPPYWSLGFHLSRFGLRTTNETAVFYKRNRDAGIPLDVIWNDIDYMDNRNDFTVSPDRFSGLYDFVNDLHKAGLHYVPIIDVGVGSRCPAGTYPPYDEGIKEDIFIKNSSNFPLEGQVWNPKGTVFPDFTNPKTVIYALQQHRRLYKQVTFDGIWLDMNEPSNFVDGSQTGCVSKHDNLENPPYVPGVDGGRLNYLTTCMSGEHYAGFHYNVHNIHGFTASIVISFVVSTIRQKRPFLLSRSTFSGSGHFTAHWTGDVVSSWDDLKHSVGDIMSFNMFGIPMVGADICGFNGNTTKQLCQRWTELGAFYPFSRNHNTDDGIDQDPAALGGEVLESAKKVLTMRYRLLPYLYTLFWNAHKYGTTVARPLFFEFPDDVNTYTEDTQFFWGPALLIVPVLTENALSVTSYFPKSIWFDAYTFESHRSNGDRITIAAPLDKIPLYFRGGFIVPWQEPAQTTTKSRLNPFGLYVAINENSIANGELFWDDGESYNTYDDYQYNFIEFEYNGKTLCGIPSYWGYNTTMILNTVYVMGLDKTVDNIYINNIKHTDFEFVSKFQKLTIKSMKIDLSESFMIQLK